jgi:hypothetical protein
MGVADGLNDRRHAYGLDARFISAGGPRYRGLPFTDSLFGRFSATSEQMDGYYTNRFLASNPEVDHRDIQNLRGALRFTPGENWTIDFTAQLGREDSGN